jgi:hypothetical protein
VRPGRYAATDGSFGRSAGAAVGRGVILLAVALVIGVILLNATDGAPPGSQVVASTKKKDDGVASTTTTTAPVVPTTAPTAAHAPAEVKVIVANGSGATGVGRKATDLLRPAKYNVLAPTNAANTAESSVYFAPGYDKDAAAIATTLQLAPTSVKALPSPPPITDSKGANVVVVLGGDAATKYGTTTATTAKAATTTTAKAGTATTTTAKAGTATTTTAKPAATTTTAKP